MYLRSAELRCRSNDQLARCPFGLAVVRALADVEFGPVTVVVGGNGTGRSALVEALAVAAGFNPEGGSRNLQSVS
jgi:predicted ATPase